MLKIFIYAKKPLYFYFRFRIMIHLKLLFVYSMRYGSRFIFFPRYYTVVPASFDKNVSFFKLNYASNFLKID